ncbi:MAG: hypothetical protein CV080_00330 [Candidatus Kuenenia stuttgartiensis]|jgi:hypothetical protein|nr:MAG: hypothetical protein CV080_00330 [Candidatus Kuenenia stuttgartiensis]
MEEDEAIKHQNRRRKPDFWIRSLRWFVVTSWILMITALLIFGAAIPEVESFFDRKFSMQLISTWNLKLSSYLFHNNDRLALCKHYRAGYKLQEMPA